MKTLITLILFTGLALRTHAQGIVYFSCGAGIQVGSRLTEGEFTMDMNGDGTMDFRFVSATPFSGGFYLEPKNQNRILGYPSDAMASAYKVRRLGSGNDISAAAAPSLEWVGYKPQPLSSVTGPYLLSSFGIGDSGGEFAPVGLGQPPEGYVGIRFFAADGLHYGWIRVRGGYFNDGTILDYAYNSVPGQTIAAGAVPEPSTWALMGLGLAALCLLRKRSSA